ncbi:STAS domain-containing protein [Micromonospora sp. WMMD735]|uniref:STAS domain-containing protein n=1 Tax=Micromonospora sp. WMMD735 TaxID=3404130 RepID=UPI003B94CCB1
MPLPAHLPEPSGPVLTLSLSSCRAGRLVIARGELDMSTTHLLTELVDQLVRRPRTGPPQLILDLTGVTFFCAAGVNALLTVQHTLRERSVRLLLCGLSPRVQRILDITGDRTRFDIRPVAEALDAPHTDSLRVRPTVGVTTAQAGRRGG